MMNAIRLSPTDNVAVLVRSLAGGEDVEFEGQRFGGTGPLGLGHKVAAREIAAGEKIIKYGVPIGSATERVAAGAHVHLHNMKSDYLPTYTLETGREFGRA